MFCKAFQQRGRESSPALRITTGGASSAGVSFAGTPSADRSSADFFPDVAVAGDVLDGFDEGGSVGGGGVASGDEFSVLAGEHDLVVVLDNQEPGQFVPALHHLVRVGYGLGSEVVGHFTGRHFGDMLLDFGLVFLIEVLQLVLGFPEVSDHHAVSRINHVGHEVAHPESALG